MSDFIRHKWKEYGTYPEEQGWQCGVCGIRYTERKYIERKSKYIHGSWVLNILAKIDGIIECSQPTRQHTVAVTDTCPYCGFSFKRSPGGDGRQRHIARCARMPGRDTLEALIESGVSYAEIGRRYGVSRSFVARQCKRLGIRNPRSPVPLVTNRPSRELDLVLELAPLRGLTGKAGCSEKCPGWAACHERGKVGLWSLCCAPERDEAERAEKRLGAAGIRLGVGDV